MVGRPSCKTVSVVQYTIMRKKHLQNFGCEQYFLEIYCPITYDHLKKEIFLYNCFLLFVHANMYLLGADHRSGSVQDDGKLHC